LVTRLVSRRGDSGAILFAAGLGLVILVGTGAFGLIGFNSSSPFLSATTIHGLAALLSSGLVAAVIAQHGRNERRQRLSVQAELQRVYDATPVGLFSLDKHGKFTRTNNAFRNMLWARVPPSEQIDWASCFGELSWKDLSTRVATE